MNIRKCSLKMHGTTLRINEASFIRYYVRVNSELSLKIETFRFSSVMEVVEWIVIII